MAVIRVTITDHTQGGFKLADIIRASASNSIAGLSISGFNKNGYSNFQFGILQHVYASGATFLYVGDKKTTCTSTTAGMELRPGEREPLFPTAGNTIKGMDIWLNSDVDGAIFSLYFNVL